MLPALAATEALVAEISDDDAGRDEDTRCVKIEEWSRQAEYRVRATCRPVQRRKKGEKQIKPKPEPDEKRKLHAHEWFPNFGRTSANANLAHTSRRTKGHWTHQKLGNMPDGDTGACQSA